MVQELKQSTAIVVHIGPFVDVTDGFTPEIAVTLSGADEAEVLKHAATTTTSISSLTWTAVTSCDGWYRLSLGTGETDTLGMLEVIVQDDSVCLPVHKEFMVLTANAWDSKYSTDVRDVNVIQWLGSAAAAPTVAGVPEVDITHLGGVTQSATDLKDFADAGYDPATNKVQGVVLCDTTTTNTDMAGTDSAALASVCTEGRLAELDAGSLPTDIAAIPTGDENADALLDRANGIETGLTLRQAQRLIAAAAAGKISGAETTTVVIRNAVADVKARITGTVDADGNRSAVTTDVT